MTCAAASVLTRGTLWRQRPSSPLGTAVPSISLRWATPLPAVLATGFDALVNRRANQVPRPKGATRYALATMAELRVFSPLQYRLTLDGECASCRRCWWPLATPARTAAGCLSAPGRPYDGLLDVTIIHPVGRLKFETLP